MRGFRPSAHDQPASAIVVLIQGEPRQCRPFAYVDGGEAARGTAVFVTEDMASTASQPAD